MSFHPTYYTEQQRGKLIPHTKRRYIWLFTLNSQSYQLQLLCSFISSKRMVALNGNILHQSRNFGFNFDWKIDLEGVEFAIKQDIQKFNLWVNGREFVRLLQDEVWGEKAERVREACSDRVMEIVERKKQVENWEEMSEFDRLSLRYGSGSGYRLSQVEVIDPRNIALEFQNHGDQRSVQEYENIESNLAYLDDQEEEGNLVKEQKQVQLLS